MPNTQVRNQIRERFAQIAQSPGTERVFPVGPTSAKNLGYDADEIDALPAEVAESFSGAGNPLALGGLVVGQTVLDLGCGAGLDSILAARRVGPTGKVVAVDMTEAMLDKARRNAAAVGISNIEWHLADAGNLPVADGVVDVVITNGVLNLCQDKPKALAELHAGRNKSAQFRQVAAQFKSPELRGLVPAYELRQRKGHPIGDEKRLEAG